MWTSTVLAASLVAVATARMRMSWDADWRFHLGDIPGYIQCDNSTFPINLNGTQCYGLSQYTAATSAEDCSNACCAGSGCTVWQWCPPGDNSCGAPGECWIGNTCAQNASVSGWVSSARTSVPGPPPYQTSGVTTLNYTDSDWRLLNVPHDFVVEGTFTPTADRGHGYLPFNISWYRAHRSFDASWAGQLIWIDFDGVYRNSDVWVNGVWLGHRDSGYVSFRYWLHNATNPNTGEPVLNYGGVDNVIVVRADALTAQEGWFYEGGGIYRHVWLNVANNVSVVPWGVYVPSQVQGSIQSPNAGDGVQTADSALVVVSTDLANANAATSNIMLVSTITDGNGNTVATTSSAVSLAPGGWSRQSQSMTITNVTLWNTAAPYMYTLTTQVMAAGNEIDAVATPFGVRSAIFDANQGFILNGIRTKVQGVCNHQDFAGCGSAVPNRVNEFRVSALRQMGAIGWRTAHNPVNPELLDYTDQYGMLVWAENRFINNGVQPLSAGDDPVYPTVDPLLLRDAQDMVLRDRNHPSIIIWSLCNEGGCQIGNPLGFVYSSSFKQVMYQADTSRPITGNSEYVDTDTFTQSLDVMAFSYNYGEYDAYHSLFPWKPLMGGEAASCTSDRGYYLASNGTTGHVNADDLGCVQGAWQPAALRDWVAGNFAWTGFDYKGEPTPFSWPDINSHFGIIDIAGFPKDSYGYYRAWWRNDPTFISTLPSHWTQPVQPGTSMTMYVFAVAASAELIVNGVSQGNVSIPYLGVAQFNNIMYVPGNLTAISYDGNGNVLAKTTLQTAEAPYALSARVDGGDNGIYADGQDTALVAFSVVDVNGVVVGNAVNNMTFTLSGVPGSIYGVGNGDPADHGPDKATTRSAFMGYARVLVQAGNVTGTITVTASSPGLQPASANILVITPPTPSLPRA